MISIYVLSATNIPRHGHKYTKYKKCLGEIMCV